MGITVHGSTRLIRDRSCSGGGLVIRILLGLAIIIGILGGILAIALIVDRWAERKEKERDAGKGEDDGFS